MTRHNTDRWLGVLFSFLLVMLTLSQCWLVGESDYGRERLWEDTNQQDPNLATVRPSSEQITLTPTSVLASDTDQSGFRSGSEVETSSIPTVAPDPLRFVFPDSLPNPVSAWRPPLYPIPWVPTDHDHFYFSRPIAADEVNWPLANYRYGGVFFDDQVHTGVDYPASKGTPVLAAGDGKVIWSDWGLYRGVPGDTSDPYGIAVVIRHHFGFGGLRLFTVYGHLEEVHVPLGAQVRVGEKIGLVGDTGFVTGPHLHFEVRVGESNFFRTYNPELWVVPPEGWGVAAARIMDTAGYAYSDEIIRIESIDTGRVWQAIPYAEEAVNSDPFYGENMVISDLPAGWYLVRINYGGRFYEQAIEIQPGRVTFFSFKGRNGFSLYPPPDPGESYSPAFLNPDSP